MHLSFKKKPHHKQSINQSITCPHKATHGQGEAASQHRYKQYQDLCFEVFMNTYRMGFNPGVERGAANNDRPLSPR